MGEAIFTVLFSLLLANARASVMIGDSHSVMSFGQAIQAVRPDVRLYAVSGSTAADWSREFICSGVSACPFVWGYATPEGRSWDPLPALFEGLRRILAEDLDRRAVIVALGTNDATAACRGDWRKAFEGISKLLEITGDHECVWVGPPRYTHGPLIDDCGARYELFVDQLRMRVLRAGCVFIDSRDILDSSTGKPIEANLQDGIHFDDHLGRFWGEQVADQITSKLVFSASWNRFCARKGFDGSKFRSTKRNDTIK